MVTHDPELARRAPRNIQVVDGQLADFTLYQGTQNLKAAGV
jgi:putative ABC transport system ATP-binding protein